MILPEASITVKGSEKAVTSRGAGTGATGLGSSGIITTTGLSGLLSFDPWITGVFDAGVCSFLLQETSTTVNRREKHKILFILPV
jgi:hypothetical protein